MEINNHFQKESNDKIELLENKSRISIINAV